MAFPSRILFATDGSAVAALARARVVELAGTTGAQVHLLHVALVSPWTHPRPLSPALLERVESEGRPLLDAEAEVLRQSGVQVTPHLRVGRATDEILRLRDQVDADLIVLGNRGQNAFTRVLLGSDAEGVVRHAPCAVMVVRAQEEGR
jgi:universal stress protein A